MQIGIIGLGRMGMNMALRLLNGRHTVIAYNRSPEKVKQITKKGAKGAHLWNQGSVVRSWLLELAESAFKKDKTLSKIEAYVEDSGEGRWTVQQAVDTAVSAPVITASLFQRFRSRDPDSFSDKLLAALRNEFGGHSIKKK